MGGSDLEHYSMTPLHIFAPFLNGHSGASPLAWSPMAYYYFVSIGDYRTQHQQAEGSLKTWRNVSFGLGLASVLLAPPVSPVIVACLVGLYLWRRRCVDRDIDRAWKAFVGGLPDEEVEKAREVRWNILKD